MIPSQSAALDSSECVTSKSVSALVIDSALASKKRGRAALSTLSNLPIEMTSSSIGAADKLFWR